MRITPHWFADNARFWYRNDLSRGAKEFILVDAEKGSRESAFDHKRLAESLSRSAEAEYSAERLPFDEITFSESGTAVSFRVRNTIWKCDLKTYACTKDQNEGSRRELDQAAEVHARVQQSTDEEEEAAQVRLARNTSLAPEGPPPSEGAEEFPVVQQPPFRRSEVRSPDRKWTAFIRDYNVWVRSDEKEVQLSKDGKEGQAYSMMEWTADSGSLVAFRVEPGEQKEVYLIESSPRGEGRARLQTRAYALPGDRFTSYELNLFRIEGAVQVKPDVGKVDFGRPRLRWRRDGHTFTYEKVDRGHQRFRLIEVDAHTGEARNLIDEQTKTFIWTAHTQRETPRPVTWLRESNEIIYCSEKDGWRHLYLLDGKDGTLKNRITQGEFVVRAVDRIDEGNRQIWFQACGKNPDQDPYLMHHYRVNFDGTGLVALTEGNGWHAIAYSPDRKYIIDSYDRVDMAPVHELRRVSDGKLVCALEKADDSELRRTGWSPPEVFHAKGRDGTTGIWGIICRPRNFDPMKKYPVIESIYAGPHDSHVPKRYSTGRPFSSLTDLGFIVAKVDGMGTANRSKAFHDVCWHNLKDAGFPDRILWHKAVAEKYPPYDITRVGIYGGSAGGQNAMGGLLFHPEFYKVGVAGCGCHDNRMDKASWNEQWMGYPVGRHYAQSSNVDNARRLRGKLLLIVGELDTNVPPESTLRVVNALIAEGKDFDMLLVPGAGHGMGGSYGSRRMHDFFVRHLHGVEPPDRNAARDVGQ
jgi:dipeptidyl aminopeptidase/acylaminoacyl peptidase